MISVANNSGCRIDYGGCLIRLREMREYEGLGLFAYLFAACFETARVGTIRVTVAGALVD